MAPVPERSADLFASLDRLVDSLDGLEALLAMSRAPGRAWTAEELARDLQIAAPATADRLLRQFVERGLVRQDEGGGAFRWAPLESEKEHLLRIQKGYQTRRIDMINHVASSSIRRIRTLADAFRIRRSDPE